MLLAGIVLVGNGARLPAQTGDCYGQLPGCLDVAFGINGKVSVPQGMTINSLVIQTIGGEERIVAVGFTPGSRKVPGAWMIARYLPDGTLDPSFGSGGIVKQTFTKSGGAQGVTIQPDQKLVVTGSAPPLSKPSSMDYLPTIARYNTNGSLDTAFGKGGFVQVRCSAKSNLPGDSYAAILQADLRIVALGFYVGHLAVFRLNSNGTLDTTFNGTGQYFESNPSCAFGLAKQWIDGEERIVVSGNMGGTPTTYQKAVLLRFTSAGLLDPSFGSSGVVLMDFTPFNDGYGPVTVDSANRIIVSWAGDDHIYRTTQYTVVRHNPDGSLDNNFGDGGKVSPYPPPGFLWPVEIEADGKILTAGWAEGYTAIWRFLDSGVADMTFGVNGWITTDFGYTGNLGARDVVLQSDGKFVVGGGSTIARYWN